MAVGLLLAVPAAIALVIGYAWPTGRTIAWSLQERAPLGGGGEFVGFENYSRVGGEVAGTLPFTLGLAVLPLLALLVVGPLLALAAHHAGKPIRLTVRVVLGVLIVCFTPVGIAVGWLIERWVQDLITDVDLAWLGAWLVVGLGMFGFAAAIGTSLFLSVLRGREPGRSAWSAGVVVGGLAAITTVALALQVFTYPFIVTRGGPLRTTATPMLDAYELGFILFDFGAGSAAATMLLLPVMLLGVGAALLVIFSGLRTEWVPAAPGKASVPAAVVAVLGVLLVLVVAGIGLWPWLIGLGRIDTNVDAGGLVLEGPSAAGLIVRAWAPTLLSTALGVGLAALAGFGIGGLRPLGRWSELLLLPFAPWLFIGVGPLFLAQWTAADDPPIQRVDTFLGLIPPIWLVVPALFVFTLLFRGLARQAATEPAPGARYGRMLLRALPMLAVVGAATWLVQSQGLLWPLGIALDPDSLPAQLFVVQQVSQFAQQPGGVALGLVYPLLLIVLFVAGAIGLQLFYLDRLAIRIGRNPQPPPG